MAELVRVTQPIVRCGEYGDVGRRGLVLQRGVRAFPIVVVEPPVCVAAHAAYFVAIQKCDKF